MGVYTSMNPATGEVLATYPEIDDDGVDTLVQRAAATQRRWAATPAQQRSAALRRAAEIHRERVDELAWLLTVEMGKPITQSRNEVKLVASIYEYYADHLEAFLADHPLPITGEGTAVVRSEPIGALLGVMPWNFPYYQVARFAAPNLALGNTVIVKHSRNCPQSALAIEEVLREAGVPEGGYANAFISSGQVAGVIGDHRIAGVSLTGSERAGEAIGAAAGRALKRCVLELGGSDPFLVLDDADVAKAATVAAAGRVYNAGQACTASKRFIVDESVYEEFLTHFADAMKSYVPADPATDECTMGPLSSADGARELDDYVQEAVSHGARIVVGGRKEGDESAFYPPTILVDVPESARAYHEELFGPVAVVHSVDGEEAAVQMANDSVFGLAGTVFSGDRARARAVADRIETGMVGINSLIRSAPDLPFGGVKRSGVGRELARDGFVAFANQKLVRDVEAPEAATR
ncbi:aldehyde dehydrogenase family protein [Nesterenkonia muleiensis]|uniref:aldehyde dehydrogenase family protein n=1 Tax=Nesterenkonia muleiensis TaxID=2282648 RepID=UPI000E72BC8B|nr:aldehyde dehydrogenase family protein [Nesterenkonia muleiensis]